MERWGLDGPYFDDLHVGQQLERAPAITIGPGECALYQAICGDPLPIALSAPLAAGVTGQPGGVVNPALALQVAIGQSTVATRRVIANLFYRGVALHRTVRVGETLSTAVVIRALSPASTKPGRPPRGKALLGIRTTAGGGDVVADFERCALLPCRGDLARAPGATADLPGAATPTGDAALGGFERFVPAGWRLDALGGPDPWQVGETRTDPLRDTVTQATALVRLTQNLAAAHRDAGLGQRGRRLVYGGHTIGLAQASLCRLLPSVATVVGWIGCDHVAPVFEDDVLSVSATLDATRPLSTGRLLAFTVVVDAERALDAFGPDGGVDGGVDGGGGRTRVLAWQPVVYAP